MIEAHIKDGVAVTKFLYWIKNSNIKKLDEIKVEKKLESFRKQSKNYLFPSFSTIAGSGPNGAIIHYRSNKKSNRKLNKDHLLVVASGGQYKWGTTDITRTISFNDPSKKTKELYTRVLKGHIAVIMSKIDKLKNIKKEFLKNKISFHGKDDFFKILSSLKGKSFCIDSKTCSVFNEKLINSKFLIKKKS